MKTTLSTSEAADILFRDENANWSYAGARALIEYLEQLEEDSGEETELDYVAVRCDWSESSSLQDWAEGYFSDWKEDLSIDIDCDDEETIDEKIRDHINENGTLIEFQGGVIVSSF